LDDCCWHRSDIYNDCLKPAGIDGKIMSLCALPGNKAMSHLLTLKRPPGEREFEPREMRLVHLFHHELNEALGAKLAFPSPVAVEALPPRLRQVLDCLLQGDSEQQAARQLRISAHTVHEYAKRLHRRFGVSSRGELLACVLTGGQSSPLAASDAENQPVTAGTVNLGQLMRGRATIPRQTSTITVSNELGGSGTT